MKRLTTSCQLRSVMACAALSVALGLSASQPYGFCWHPDDLLEWNGENPDLKFNRSLIPLQPRTILDGTMKANPGQQCYGQITNATILYPRCSAAPSQGAYTFTGYQPTYWQYMDKLVYWAGSASEGIIIPPPAPTVDAAHLSGVKVLGQVFFPPTYYGGKREWVTQMLTRLDNGSYPYAEKLFEVARDLGFDGWFINEETGGGTDSQWAEFVAAFNAKADAEGYPEMEIQWYNASRTPNTTILKAHPNTSQFLEYGAIGDLRSYAEKLNCSEEETFSKLYGGIECVKAGLTGYGSYLDRAFPASGSICSVALFCPEEHSWKDNVKNILDTEDCGPKAYAAVKKVFADEETAWVNASGNPSITQTGWKGISGYVEERSAITSLPFRSDFCVGVGKGVYSEGSLLSAADWHHSGVQSVLPTWRWWIENPGELKVDIDWDQPYNLGNSFLIHGLPNRGGNLIRLYKTKLLINEGDYVTVTYMGTVNNLNLALATNDYTSVDTSIAPASVTAHGEWKEARYNLSQLKGQTVYMIALDPSWQGINSEVEFRLGSIAVLPGRPLRAPEISNVEVNATLGQENGEIRVTWDYTPNTDFDYFRLLVKNNGKILVTGNTRGSAFYFPAINRTEDGKLDVEIQTILKDGTIGYTQTIPTEFEALGTPEVRYLLSKSYLSVGEEATIIARATNFPTSYTWFVPSGLQLVETIAENEIKVKALTEGCHSVRVDVTNPAGKTIHSCETIDVLTEDELFNLGNVVRRKTIVDCSGMANEKEGPQNIIDGVTRPSSVSGKWCSLDYDSWVTFDTEDYFRIYGFKIYDCKSGPENAENFHSYKIELSIDGETWDTVLDEIGLQDQNIKEHYIAPAAARYIRFSPSVTGVLRIWEFEAYGLPFDISAISEIETDEADKITDIYSIEGIRLSELREGINIVKFASGKVIRIIR